MNTTNNTVDVRAIIPDTRDIDKLFDWFDYITEPYNLLFRIEMHHLGRTISIEIMDILGKDFLFIDYGKSMYKRLVAVDKWLKQHGKEHLKQR
jgi:hypothetical protein